MAWGVFAKKLKEFGQKVVDKVKKGSEFIQNKALPTLRKVNEATKAFNPYSGLIDTGLDWMDTATKKTSKIDNMSDVMDISAKEWLKTRK